MKIKKDDVNKIIFERGKNIKIKSYSAGDSVDPVLNTKNTEINICICGRCSFFVKRNNSEGLADHFKLNSDEAIIIPSMYIVKFIALTDCKIISIRDGELEDKDTVSFPHEF